MAKGLGQHLLLFAQEIQEAATGFHEYVRQSEWKDVLCFATGGRAQLDAEDIVPDIQKHARELMELSCMKMLVVNTDFCAKGPHFSAKRKIFPLTVKDAERALFARIQLGRSWARYPGRPRAFFGEPHVDVTWSPRTAP